MWDCPATTVSETASVESVAADRDTGETTGVVGEVTVDRTDDAVRSDRLDLTVGAGRTLLNNAEHSSRRSYPHAVTIPP